MQTEAEVWPGAEPPIKAMFDNVPAGLAAEAALKTHGVLRLPPTECQHLCRQVKGTKLTAFLLQTEAEVRPVAEDLAQAMFDHIPVGVGSQGIIPTTMADLEAALEMGMDFSIREVLPPTHLL